MGSGIPRFHPSAGGFTRGMRTNYGSFSVPGDRRKTFEIARAQDSDEEEEEEEDDTHRYRSRSRHVGVYEPKHRATSYGKTVDR